MKAVLLLESFKPLLTINSTSPGEEIYFISESNALSLTLGNLRFGSQRRGSCSAALSEINNPRFGGAVGSILSPSLADSL